MANLLLDADSDKDDGAVALRCIATLLRFCIIIDSGSQLDVAMPREP